MPSKNYPRSSLVDGESCIGPVGQHQILTCCDCGLAHSIWPSYDAQTQQVSIMFVRNNKETKIARRKLRRKREGVFKRWPKRKTKRDDGQ